MTPLVQTAVRRENLARGFHFHCHCRRCVAGDVTDAALEEMRALQLKLSEWHDPNSNATPEVAEQLIALYEQEGLEGFMEDGFGFAALANNAVGNATKARHYAKLALQATVLKDGRRAHNLPVWSEFLADPKKHWSWRRRK